MLEDDPNWVSRKSSYSSSIDWLRGMRSSDETKSTTPTSEAMMTKPSLVSTYLEGLRPFLSSMAPTISPSEKVNKAGPSQGSMRSEDHLKKFSFMTDKDDESSSSADLALLEVTASGTIVIMASGNDLELPALTKNSRTLSTDPESEASASTTGYSFDRFVPNLAEAMIPSRALIQFTFPRRVLISP